MEELLNKKTKKMAQPVFIVEKVLDKRKTRGEIKYLLKWRNYSHEHNSWEPLDNLDCPDLIQEFEEKCNKDTDTTDTDSCDLFDDEMETCKIRSSESNTDNGLIAENILYEYESLCEENETMFLVAWAKGIPSVVSSKWFKKKYPQLVNEFYERKEEFMYTENVNMEQTNKTLISSEKEKYNDLIPVRIVGAKPDEENENDIIYLIEWTNHTLNLVNGKNFRNKYPQIVIQFYETKLRFIDENVKDERRNDKSISREKENLSEKYRGLIPEKILGAKPDDTNEDKYLFLVKWKNKNNAILVPSSFAYNKFPQIVIDFLETNIEWYDVDYRKN